VREQISLNLVEGRLEDLLRCAEHTDGHDSNLFLLGASIESTGSR
jgi:hypothetical protein